MKKSELLKVLATSANVNQTQADAVLSAFTTVLTSEVLIKGDSITIPGLGTFKQSKSAARTGRNPQTGAAISIPASVKIHFSMSSSLK
jgi:DNA-binding protein HU-beta